MLRAYVFRRQLVPSPSSLSRGSLLSLRRRAALRRHFLGRAGHPLSPPPPPHSSRLPKNRSRSRSSRCWIPNPRRPLWAAPRQEGPLLAANVVEEQALLPLHRAERVQCNARTRRLHRMERVQCVAQDRSETHYYAISSLSPTPRAPSNNCTLLPWGSPPTTPPLLSLSSPCPHARKISVPQSRYSRALATSDVPHTVP